MFSPEAYAERRAKLTALLRAQGIGNGLVFLPGNRESPRNYASNAYPFRQNSTWLYFMGLSEPDLAAIIDIENGTTCLYGRERPLEEAVWTGPLPSLSERAALTGAESFAELGAAASLCEAAARRGLQVLHPPCERAETAEFLASVLGVDALRSRGGSGPALVRAIVALREIKEEREIVELESAVAATAKVHELLIESLRPGWSELDAAWTVRALAAEQGLELSFNPVATVRGEILHNSPTARTCGAQDIFLLDAGLESPEGYAGDLTSTFPVGPRFSPRHADLYRALFDVFEYAISQVGPGRLFADIHLAICRRLAQRLADLGLMKGDPADAVAAGAHALFFPHGLGHMIGLDVHDMEGLGEDIVGYGNGMRSSQFGLSSLRLAKRLEPGMVHSIEPGVYLIGDLIDDWNAKGKHKSFIRYAEVERWKGIGGFRVEEDWLVLADGARRLGPYLDKRPEAIEGLRSFQ